jgi:hypothetical protein
MILSASAIWFCKITISSSVICFTTRDKTNSSITFRTAKYSSISFALKRLATNPRLSNQVTSFSCSSIKGASLTGVLLRFSSLCEPILEDFLPWFELQTNKLFFDGFICFRTEGISFGLGHISLCILATILRRILQHLIRTLFRMS